MNEFIVSDTHFSHPNILKYEAKARPFKSVEEHDEELIRRWNEKVSPEDVVYHLGDFCFWNKKIDPKKFISKLNGKIRLIAGNHDKLININNFKELGFNSYHDYQFLERDEKAVLLVHYPIYLKHYQHKPSRKDLHIHHFDYVLHGHVHSNTREVVPNFTDDRGVRFINVSCEMTNLSPIKLTEACKL